MSIRIAMAGIAFISICLVTVPASAQRKSTSQQILPERAGVDIESLWSPLQIAEAISTCVRERAYFR